MLEAYTAVFKFMLGEARQVLKDPYGASSGLLSGPHCSAQEIEREGFANIAQNFS